MECGRELGPRFLSLEVLLSMEGGRLAFTDADFGLAPAAPGRWEGRFGGMTLRLRADGVIALELVNRSGLRCDSLGWRLTYRDKEERLAEALAPCLGKDVGSSGLKRLGTVRRTAPDSVFSGFFAGARRPCLLLATRLPQKNLHLYEAELLDDHTVRFQALTRFPEGQRGGALLRTEETHIFQGLTPLEALRAYARLTPPLPRERFAAPLVGWNSWDYYYRTVSARDVEENLDFIRSDPLLQDALRCLIIDDGWAHCEGEWRPNYRFPEGLAPVAERIRAQGLVPGIWTNGCQVQTLSLPAMRQSDMLVRREDGTPLTVGGLYVIDPTHPLGEAFLFELYSGLCRDGFRIFKVDFVDALLQAERFYDPAAGPYDAIRRLFATVRRAVGPESHILGCSYPMECGAGYVDSSRTGVDIHNQWTHVLWCLEYLQLKFWTNGRLFRVDPDFLILRGGDTSLEAETNVFNPAGALPYDPATCPDRWRRGPVFDRWEAETWANLVSLSAGNLLLSDRLSRLNGLGLELLHSRLTPGLTAAEPLDLGESAWASLWLERREDGGRLLIINHEDRERDVCFRFSAYGLEEPEDLTSSKPFACAGGAVTARLRRHESTVLCWGEPTKRS